MYHSYQMRNLRKAHYHSKKAYEYMERVMRSSRPCGYPYDDDRYDDSFRWPRRYGEYRSNPCHMDSSSCHTYTDDETLLDA